MLDANVFIEAARRYYSFDIAPPFWTALVDYAKKGNLCSIDKVKDELEKGKDALANWAKQKFKPYFHATNTESVITNYSTIIQLTQNDRQYNESAKNKFREFENADPWLVAFAMTSPNYVIVTQETYDATIKRNIPIPNVCKLVNVKYIDTFAMLRSLNFQFK